MSDIFLSYAREDRDRVNRLVDALAEAGLSVWWDRKIETGSHFDEVLDRELKSSGTVVVVWSQHSIGSDWVRSEAHEGFERGILMPVLFEAVVPPLPFRRMQSADLIGWPDSDRSGNEFIRLVEAINRVLQAASSGLRKRKTSAPQSARRVGPAVAVLPLTNRSDNPDDEYLADGITEDIITRLQRFRTFPIIPRHSVFGYKGKPFDLPEIARQLDVAYLVVGQTRSFSDRIRISIDLIETREFHSVFSENFDREIEDIFNLQDEISIIIAAMLQPEIERSERQQELPSHTESIESWHLVRRGSWHQYKLTREDAAEARRYFELALEQNPNSVEALVSMAWWYWWDLSARRGRREDWAVVTEYARRASVIDPKDARPHLQIGVATMMGGNPKAAIKIFDEAIRLNPCFAIAYGSLGSAYEVTGEPGKALRALDKAIKLSPFDYNIFHAHGERACAFYSAREFEQAIDAAEMSLNLRPGYWLAHLIKTVSLARAGRIDEAKMALASLLRFHKNFGLRDIQWIGYTDPGRVGEMVDALQIAGWQPDIDQNSGV